MSGESRQTNWIVGGLVALAVLVVALPSAWACVNTSYTDTARGRYMHSYRQVRDASARQRVEGVDADAHDYDGGYRRPIPYLADLEVGMLTAGQYYGDRQFPASWWAWQVGMGLSGLLLLGLAVRIGRRRRRQALVDELGDGEVPLDAPSLSPATVYVAMTLAVGLGGGLLVADMLFADWAVTRAVFPAPTTSVPPPHHFPRAADVDGGQQDSDGHGDSTRTRRLTLRFAMVKDVLHERYVRPGEAYYRARNRQVEQKRSEVEWDLDGTKPDSRWFGWTDDLAMGLERIGQFERAEELLRTKLEVERHYDLGKDGEGSYTTFANLGTVLIHSGMKGALGGNQEDKARVEEGLAFIRRAIAVNPMAHFGREMWQAAAVEYLLAGIERPKWFRDYDVIGQRLEAEVPYAERRDAAGADRYLGARLTPRARPLFESGTDGEGVSDPEPFIRRVGAEAGWDEGDWERHDRPVPFDEPVLGMIGMWRMGGGPNPHFALAIGGVLERVGRPQLAWTAYERARRMKEGWPAGVRDHLTDYCETRQKRLAAHLDESAEQLRGRFERNLEEGQALKEQYHAYERRRLEETDELDPATFYDAFHQNNPSITSAPTDHERATVAGWVDPDLGTTLAAGPLVLLVGALVALGRALTFNPAAGPDDESA